MSSSLIPAAGELSTQCTIQQIASTAVDDNGEAVHTWEAVQVVWAKVEDLRGAENWRAATTDPTADYRLTLHHVAGITAEMRVEIGSRYLGITHVQDPQERGAALVLTCREGR